MTLSTFHTAQPPRSPLFPYTTLFRSRRHNHDNLHVRGYKEEGTTTTAFDMTVLNDLDRFHLAGDAVDRVPKLQRVGGHFRSEEHTSELQSLTNLVCRLLLEKKK